MTYPRQNNMDDLDFVVITAVDRPTDTGRHRSPQFNKDMCRCKCNNPCRDKTGIAQEASTTSSPARGRSLTPKYDRTNGEGKPIEARPTPREIDLPYQDSNTSVHGQEGLADHQLEQKPSIEVGDLGAHAADSIQRWLAQHHGPHHAYCFSTSPEASMLVEASTAPPSLASSGYLPSRMASSGELLNFATGGFEEMAMAGTGAQQCAFTPLWLTHELRYCRNMRFGEDGGSVIGYPAELDLGDGA